MALLPHFQYQMSQRELLVVRNAQCPDVYVLRSPTVRVVSNHSHEALSERSSQSFWMLRASEMTVLLASTMPTPSVVGVSMQAHARCEPEPERARPAYPGHTGTRSKLT